MLPKTQTVSLNLSPEPGTLDPRKARDLTSCTLIRMLFEGLTRSSKEGTTELAIAKQIDISEDGTRYTFYLRDSQWSNGDEVTSYDFASSWKTMLDPRFPSDVVYHLFPIRNAQSIKKGELSVDSLGVQTPDALTLVVELETPIPYFLELVSMTPYFPVHRKFAKENNQWDLDPTQWISNGPFTLKEWRHTDALLLEKNSEYWQADGVRLEKIEFCVTAPDTAIRLFEEGKLAWTGSPLSTIPADAIQSLREKEQLHTTPFLATSFLRVNTAKPPFTNVLLRQALSIAIDRKAITEHILQGGHQPATALVPPGMGLSQHGYFPDGDVDMARSLLQGALNEWRMQASELPPITLSFVNCDRNIAIAQAIQKQWEKALGISVILEPVESKIYFQRVSRKEFELALGSWTADFNDPINFLDVFKTKEVGTNNTQWENERYIDLLMRSSLCRQEGERRQCLHAAEKILMDQMPIIPIYHFAMNFLVQEGLKGVSLSPTGGLDFRWAYWER
ncbi:MAG: peptide ABC transporter substrate-binding protein [Chlamydiia bacterium]|nr:peptide ABC transporter substrate-binding protein [Chlamydiia bacterium]